ncbi:hypothetical protein BBG03_03320 [Streptococcus dysgalactiae subsp. equisimilis]|uniref:ImmA/IrrE family metallo-endopeptidase n=1 Tax=Streptococcus dysgalactiae TaxID=1334 RepID=UPI000806F843|nr:ImmA/IrrE family metallo-endopeptidase [Streptococcus dysgalactiae]OBZ00625.1 hypothetical protein BBG03_03320 [Streptococcus dysgalactiae subsp. equisimilis]
MNPIYQSVSKIAHKEIYSFIKTNAVQLTTYTFNDYFQYITSKHKIKTFPHHFDNNLILGVTMIDEKGISISYEANSIESRQNFTKCHEIGHLILQHEGSVFAERVNSKDQQELEADYFASLVLAPDIILITKILYQKLSYQQLQEQLQVSNKALEVRLTHFIQSYTNLPYPNAKGLITSYRANTPAKERLLTLLREIEEPIISDFKAIQIDPLEFAKALLKENDFISNLDCDEILDQHFIQKVLQHHPNLSSGVYFDFGKSIHYLYKTDKLSQIEAKKIAKNYLFNLIF